MGIIEGTEVETVRWPERRKEGSSVFGSGTNTDRRERGASQSQEERVPPEWRWARRRVNIGGEWWGTHTSERTGRLQS